MLRRDLENHPLGSFCWSENFIEYPSVTWSWDSLEEVADEVMQAVHDSFIAVFAALRVLDAQDQVFNNLDQRICSPFLPFLLLLLLQKIK